MEWNVCARGVGMFSVYRDLLTVKWLRSFWGHSVHFWFSASFWKRLVIEQNAVKFGPQGEYSVYTGSFWQFSAWCHSGAFPTVTNFVSQKTAGRIAKQSEISASVVNIQYIQKTLTVTCLRSFWGHSVHFRFSTTLYLEDGWSKSETVKLGPWGKVLVYIVNFWQKIA